MMVPVLSIDENFTIFDLLTTISNQHGMLLSGFLKSSYEDVRISYVDTGTRRALITTKSIAGSVAKILSEVISVTNKSSDIFLKRVARPFNVV